MLNVSVNVEALVTRARQAYGAGDLGQVESLAQQALQVQVEHPQALHLLGAVALERGQSEAALAFLQRAVTQQPNDAGVHCDLAMALDAVGRPAEAVTHNRLALALDPELALAQEHLRQVLAAQGHADPAAVPAEGAFVAAVNDLAARAAEKNVPLAIRLYDCSLDADPNQAQVLASLGQLYFKSGQARSAIDVFRSAIRLGHRTAETYHTLARALSKQAYLEEALEAARAAAGLDPANLDVQWTVTQILADIHVRNVAIGKLRAALAADPESEELKFQLAALTDDVDLSTFPLAKVTALFEQYAQTFESHLVERLRYRGHEQIYEAVTAVAPGQSFDILDAGCGTGLCGVQFKPLARTLKGVDLSPAMIEKARARGIYDELEVADLVALLERQPERYDLILAADVLVYVGNLEPTFAAASAALRPGGLLAFSVERTDRPGFIFDRRTALFAHSLGYLQELAGRHGLAQAYAKECPLRVEGRTPLLAWIMVLRK